MISIIGAGPAGCYLGYLLAKNGKRVNIFEDHSEIGKPVQCTGIITSSIEKLIKIKKEFLVNEIYKVRVISPSGKILNFKLKNKNYVIDREKFDKYLCQKAVEAGVNLYLNHRFTNFKDNKIYFDNKPSKKTDILVGADGPSSKVAKVSGLFKKRKFVIGLQARVSMKCEKDLVEFYLDKNYFGWIVPESDKIARVGIVAKFNVKDLFETFLKKINKKFKIINYQSGLIPIYDNSIKTNKNNIYLVGDAATMVKPTTYGGLVQGLTASRELSKAILNNKNYERLWRKKLGKELKYGVLIRNVMDKFSNRDYDELFSLINKRKVKSIIENFDRDYPSKIVFKLLLKQPKLMKFIKKLY